MAFSFDAQPAIDATTDWWERLSELGHDVESMTSEEFDRAVVQAGGQVGADMVTASGAGLGAIGSLLTGGSLDDAVGTIDQAFEDRTYDLGAEHNPIYNGMMTASEPIEAAIQGAGNMTLDATGSPAAATAVELFSGMALPGKRGVPKPHPLKELPGGKGVDKFLTDPESGKLNKATASKLMEWRNVMPTAKEMASVARAGEAKRGWYNDSSDAIAKIFDDDSEMFAKLLSAMSPQTSVESNLLNVTNMWKNWNLADRPTDRGGIVDLMGESVEGNRGVDSVLDAWKNNTERALTGEPMLSGPKVQSFQRNLLGDTNEVTNDAWMARYAGIPQEAFGGSLNKVDGGKGPAYLAMNSLAREAADRLSQKTGELWTPDQVQETIWSWSKALRESQGGGKDTLDILREGKLNDSIIADTPDFGTLLAQDPYGGILGDAGINVAERLMAEQRTRMDSDHAREIYGESSTTRRDLERAARRLR